jgi:hypothetical protein
MSIERDLARIADALEKIAGSTHAAAAAVREEKPAVTTREEKPADKPKTDAAEEKPKTDVAEGGAAPSLDEVVAALQKYMKANGRDAAVELLGRFGAKRASDIDEAKRADFVKEAS